MRLADVIMSFPSLLLAVIVLYMLEPSILNLVARARHHAHPDLPADHARRGAGDPRAHVRAGGARHGRLATRGSSSQHILPVVLPTLVTIATLDFAFVMLAESSL